MSDGIFLPEMEYLTPKDWTTDPLVKELLEAGESADSIQLIDCPFCSSQTIYGGGITSLCSFCGEDVAPHSEGAYTLGDFLYERDYENYRGLED